MLHVDVRKNPVAFASKALTNENIERELLPVVYGCKKFHTFLFPSRYTIQSDNMQTFETIKHMIATPPRLQRMLTHRQQYNLTIKYSHARKKHGSHRCPLKTMNTRERGHLQHGRPNTRNPPIIQR